MEREKHLPVDLTELVNKTLSLLGQAIQNEYGKSTYNDVEKIRSIYKKIRHSSTAKMAKAHQGVFEFLTSKKPKEKFRIAHSFTVSLELINACENAYRSFRLKQKISINDISKKDPVIFVLTAHPTESRSPESIDLLFQITQKLLESLQNESYEDQIFKEIYHLVLLLIKIPLSKTKSPTVSDEAKYIYSVLFQEQNLNKLIEFTNKNQPVFIRTWVGGDKDGHPGVNAQAMLNSMNISRKQILNLIKHNVDHCIDQLEIIKSDNATINRVIRRVKSLNSHFAQLNKISANDGKKITQFNTTLSRVTEYYENNIGTNSPFLRQIQSIINLFPGLVVPLELREDSTMIKQALKDSKAAITQMLIQLKSISKGGFPSWYVRGFVVSMCESIEDISCAAKLTQKTLGELYIHIIPLFETKAALNRSTKIVEGFLSLKLTQDTLKKYWDNKFEIMLGYSDSAKESGAFFSRVMIHRALMALDRIIRKKGITPIFFHGSGGSVARGGGSIEEQISWWPKSAQNRFKATIQGEMIYRSFATPEILNRQIDKIHFGIKKKTSTSDKPENLKLVFKFASMASQKYSEKVKNEEFMNIVSESTPYPFLDQLKIGSRPSKRKDTLNLENLRAIPWVLCWTQTRVLFPVWWGLGSSWNELTQEEKNELKTAFAESDLFRSFVKLLSYSLEKVDLSIWNFYLKNTNIPQAQKAEVFKSFQVEYDQTCDFVFQITGSKELLWYRPWLSESIHLRSTMIYPLNVLELDALKRKDMPLLRECVTGVASGMLTTG